MNVTPRKLQGGVTGVGRERAGGVDFGWVSIQRDFSSLVLFFAHAMSLSNPPLPVVSLFCRRSLPVYLYVLIPALQ